MIIASAASLREKTFPPLRYAAPPYIAEGCTILAGRPKLGKSWLMLAIGLDVAREDGDVLYLALEDNERRLKARMTKLLGASGVWPAGLQYATQWLRSDVGGLFEIKRWIKETEKPRLVVVDVFANFRPPRGHDAYESDYAAVKDLQRIASESPSSSCITSAKAAPMAPRPTRSRRSAGRSDSRARPTRCSCSTRQPRRDALRARARYRKHRYQR